MPELPEVETVLRGIQPHIEQQRINNVIVRQRSLRWPIPHNLKAKLIDNKIIQLQRRAKYLLLKTNSGTLILHLGMSGKFRILSKNLPAQAHDHFDIEFANKKILRFTDPRRFGACLWTELDPLLHPLLKNLGPEPLTSDFSGKHLWLCAQKRKIPIKAFIMDSKIVAGVGNIYAAEALFAARIHPSTPVNIIAENQFQQLAKEIKDVLKQAIKRGGTTLKDFLNSDGEPGYFENQLKVYGREGLPCKRCNSLLKTLAIGQRASVFCEQCQRPQTLF